MKIVVQIQIDDDSEINRVFLSFDKKGMEFLKETLTSVHFRKKGDAVHLLSDDWGAGELESEPYFEGCPIIHQLELFYLGDEGDENK